MAGPACHARDEPASTSDVSNQGLLAPAAAALEAGEAKAALKAYEKAVGTPELRVEALLGVARAQNQLRRRDKALVAAQAALESSESTRDQATAHDLIGVLQWRLALDLLLEFERLWERPGKKKPTYGEQVDEHLALAEAAHRRALELTDGELGRAWLNLVELLAATGRYREARDELVAYFEHDPNGRASAAELLAHLECVSDVAELAKVVRPEETDVEPATKQFHPSPRLAAEEGSEPARAAGVVDLAGRFRCVRIANAGDLTAELEDLFLETLVTWRFQPARLNQARVVSYHGETVEPFERP